MVWSVLFIIAPLFFVAFYAFTDSDRNFTLENITALASPSYIEIFLRSVCFAFLATLICLVIGYPIAYAISRASERGN